MLVRDAGDAWQIVLQTDHADLSAELARAWKPRPEPFGSVMTATERHDDGWAVWEQAPRFDRANGRPQNFLDVHVLSHLAFYRACIAAVTEQDPYAGLLISMHGAGIYNCRYGTQPGLTLTFAPEVRERVDEFVQEQEAGYPRRIAELEVGEDERWTNYGLLQIYDRLSLSFCLKDHEAGAADEVGEYRLEPLGPWRVGLEPFPFAESPSRFTLLRRLVPKREWAGDDDFRHDFFATTPETVEITIEEV